MGVCRKVESPPPSREKSMVNTKLTMIIIKIIMKIIIIMVGSEGIRISKLLFSLTHIVIKKNLQKRSIYLFREN